jgi:hypothetical protein
MRNYGVAPRTQAHRSIRHREGDGRDYPTGLEVQDPPLLVVTAEIGPLAPVPTTMQVLAAGHAKAISPKELLGNSNPEGPVTEVQEVPALVVITVTNGDPFVAPKPVARHEVEDPHATSLIEAVLAGRAVELVQFEPPSVEMSNSPGNVGCCGPLRFVPTARQVVVAGRQSTESNRVFCPVDGTSDHVAPPSTVCDRPDPTAIQDEVKQVIYVPMPAGLGVVSVQVLPAFAV